MDRYVVIGNPVSHSRSPEIHAMFALETGDVLRYDRMLVSPGQFRLAAAEFFAAGGKGANVTLPFKRDAFEFATLLTPRAQAAGAVNTLAARDGAILGDNTDGEGLVRDLTLNLGLSLSGARILLLGAGGAARGVVGPLLSLEPAALVIANRTAERAQALAARFAQAGSVSGTALDAVSGEYALVVNATSSSTLGEPLQLDDAVLRGCSFAYDMAYGPSAGPFLERASEAGAATSDGVGMLVEQAAESFLLWRGRRPDTRTVIAALRAP